MPQRRSERHVLTDASTCQNLTQALSAYPQETHHYYAARRVRTAEGEAAAAFREEVHPPHFDPPYQPLL